MKNKLIQVEACFDRERAEAFDSVSLNLKFTSQINVDITRIHFMFNNPICDKMIDGTWNLQEDGKFDQVIEILIPMVDLNRRGQHELVLEKILLEREEADGRKLSMVLYPTPSEEQVEESGNLLDIDEDVK